MAEESIIAWTDNTFNPAMGCTKVSAGCENCYAEVLTAGRMGIPDLWGKRGRRQRTSPANWRKPIKWNREAVKAGVSLRAFCASLCDVFEDRAEIDALRPELWDLIRSTPALDWQILTKRPERIFNCLPADWGDGWPNVWLGTSIEDEHAAHRAETLAEIPAAVRFISYEPAIGPLAHALAPLLAETMIARGGNLYREPDEPGIDWVIYGGESGPGFRPENKQWARDMRDLCAAQHVAFFHKQSAGHRTELGIELDGVMVREYPRAKRILKTELF